MSGLFTELPRTAQIYITSIAVIGVFAVLHSVASLIKGPVGVEWLVLAGLTVVTGSFSIKVPKVNARISASDAFVFSAILLFGANVATIIVAVETLILTSWQPGRSRSLPRAMFNVSAGAISVWVAAQTFAALTPPGARLEAIRLQELLMPVVALALTYFAVNSWLVAVALGFERKTSAWHVWRQHFTWLSLNYLAGASLALLLVTYTRGLNLTAVGVIVPLLVIIYLTQRTSLARVDDAQKHLAQLNQLYLSTIETLAMAVDAKDQITHGHIRRVQVYAVELAKRLGVADEGQLKALETAALLHDMGKLAIPEHILNKPGKLTTAEFDKMKRHADIGADLLSSIRFPYPVVPIVRHHHESWDGTGYPSKISGTDIPLGARILSVVDCFDALTSDRPYRPRLTPEEAFSIIRDRRGTMYDPIVVDTFVAVYSDIAPSATLAGQQARSLVPSLYAAVDDEGSDKPLRDIRENAAQASTLAEFERELERRQGLAGSFEIVTQYVRLLTPATACAFYRYAMETDSLVCTYAAGDGSHVLIGLTMKNGERVTGWVAANGRIIMNSDAALDLSEVAHQFDPSLRSTMAAPIVNRGKVLGVLTAYATKEAPFTEHHKYAIDRIVASFTERLAAVGTSNQTPTLVRFPSAESR
jgi:putative nucleotidyltransferase with HDIG domain